MPIQPPDRQQSRHAPGEQAERGAIDEDDGDKD